MRFYLHTRLTALSMDRYVRPMLGTLRYIMALLVAVAHLWRGKIDPTAHYGVFCFFIISGYLITRILCETYTFSWSGRCRFALNRILRLYPAYAVVFLLSLALLYTASDEALNYSGGMLQMHSARWWEWLANIVIVGVTDLRVNGGDAVMVPRLVNNIWSVSVELWFYMLMALGISRTPRRSVAWLLCGLGYMVYGFYQHYSFYDFYLPVPSGILPFAIGACIYHLLQRWHMPATLLKRWMGIAVILWVGNYLIATSGLYDPERAGLYLSLVPSAGLVIGFLHYRPHHFSATYQRIDIALGNLSYPLFLGHWAIAVVILWMMPLTSEQLGHGWLLALSWIPMHLLAWAIYAYVERPIEKLRARIRPLVTGALAQPPAHTA